MIRRSDVATSDQLGALVLTGPSAETSASLDEVLLRECLADRPSEFTVRGAVTGVTALLPQHDLDAASSVSALLGAVQLAQSQGAKSILFIDADRTARSLTLRLNAGDTTGIHDILGGAPLDDRTFIRGETVHVLPAGAFAETDPDDPDAPADTGRALANFLEFCRTLYDATFILTDGPARIGQAIGMARAADRTLLVGEKARVPAARMRKIVTVARYYRLELGGMILLPAPRRGGFFSFKGARS